MEARKRSTNAEVELRVTHIYTLLVNSAKRRDILNDDTVQSWALTHDAIDNYLQKATDLIKQESRFDRSYELGKAMARLDRIFAKSMKVQDFSRAIQAEKARIELLGLNAPSRTEFSGRDGGAIGFKIDFSDLTIEQLEALGRSLED